MALTEEDKKAVIEARVTKALSPFPVFANMDVAEHIRLLEEQGLKISLVSKKRAPK